MENKLGIETFDDFWTVYPRRVGKQAAIRMYKRALKITTSAAILRAAKLYAQDRMGQDQTYTKHPATWLNAGCWDDYADHKAIGGGPSSVFVKEDTEQWRAWQAHVRATTGKGSPCKNYGWYFPSEWPPGHRHKEAEQMVWAE